MRCNNKIKSLFALLIATTAFGLEWQKLDYPAAREISTMIVDDVNQRIILFGGGCPYAGPTYFNDVWEMPLDMSTGYQWFRLSAAGTPPAERFDHSAVYDSKNHRMIVLFGNAVRNFFHDVWALNLRLGDESWEMLNTVGMPTADRCAQFAVYNPLRNSVIVFAGAGYYVWYNDVWELNLDSLVWREIVVSGNRPSPRCFPGGLFDKDNNRMIIFGGNSENFNNDIWALDLTPGNEQWTELHPTGSVPIERTGFAYASDLKRNLFYVFSGWNLSEGYFNDLHVLDISTLTWTKLNPSGELPEVRRNPTGTFENFNDNFLFFGGDLGGGYSNETFFIHLDSLNNLSISDWQVQPVLNISPTIFVSSVATSSVKVRYLLPKICDISIKILDANGRVIRNLFAGKISSLSDWLTWDLKANNGQNVSSGVYMCLLEMGDIGISRKFVITK